MEHSKKLVSCIERCGINLGIGVPDSCLSGIIATIENSTTMSHMKVFSEVEAISIAVGKYAVTQEMSCVYMQNSGLFNCMNPLASLSNREMFSVPMLIIVGWRGQPSTNDIVAHHLTGKVTERIFENLQIPYLIIGKLDDNLIKDVEDLISLSKKKRIPVALLIKRKMFEVGHIQTTYDSPLNDISMAEAMKVIRNTGDKVKAKYILSNGYPSREFYFLSGGDKSCHDSLYLVGSMGCASAVALGACIFRPERKFILIEGDGSLLMHLETVATIGSFRPKNLLHIVLDNGCYNSTGGQQTNLQSYQDICKITRSLGYQYSERIDKINSILETLEKAIRVTGPSLLHIKVNKLVSADLPRIKIVPKVNITKYCDEHKG